MLQNCFAMKPKYWILYRLLVPNCFLLNDENKFSSFTSIINPPFKKKKNYSSTYIILLVGLELPTEVVTVTPPLIILYCFIGMEMAASGLMLVSKFIC